MQSHDALACGNCSAIGRPCGAEWGTLRCDYESLDEVGRKSDWSSAVVAGSHVVCILQPGGEVVVELVEMCEGKFVDEESFGIGLDFCESSVVDFVGEVDEPAQSTTCRADCGEHPVCSGEPDAGFGDRVFERADLIHEACESVEELQRYVVGRPEDVVDAERGAHMGLSRSSKRSPARRARPRGCLFAVHFDIVTLVNWCCNQ